MIARSAHHAKDVSQLHKKLTANASTSEKKGMSGDDFIRALTGALNR